MAAGTLQIVQTLQRAGGRLRFVPPKTEDSPRAVLLPDFCLNALKEHAERQTDEFDGAGDKWRSRCGLPHAGRNADGAGQPSSESGPHLKGGDHARITVTVTAAQGIGCRVLAADDQLLPAAPWTPRARAT